MALIRDEVHSNGSSCSPTQTDPRPVLLHVATRYLRGGSEHRLRDIVRALPEAEHHLVVGRDSDLALAREEIDPASMDMVATLVREPDPIRDLATFGYLFRLLGRRRYDLVVSHQSKAGVLARLAARGRGVRSVHSLSMANFGPGYPAWQDRVFRSIEARLVRTTDAYLVVGSDLARRYEHIGAPSRKLHVIRSGVTLPGPESAVPGVRAEVCEALRLPRDRSLVLYLGSLEERKNVMALPVLLRRLMALQLAPKPYLVVAGTGPLEAALRAELGAPEIAGNAAMLGFVPDPGALVRAADVVVLLSSAEGVSQVLVQATAAGTPFVAYGVDGVGELLELGADGVAVPLGDVGAAAAAVRSLVRRRSPAPGSPVDLAPWSRDAIAEGYRRVIGAVLASDGRPIRAPSAGSQLVVAGPP